MGVRGKMEAVMYAAEEPVTLQQLAALFGEEALAEREASGATTLTDDTELVAEETPEPLLEFPAVQTPEPAPESEPAHEPAEGQGLEQALEARRLARVRERAGRDAVRQIVDALMLEYQQADRGIEIREVAGGYRVATKPEYHDAVRAFVKSQKPVMKLSLQALETLAVIAYKQPVTAPEISEIRGVDSGGVLGSLISRKLVTTAGRKQVVGRPILYKTTREFLLRFGLKDIAELPSMEEFEKMAGELQALGDEPSPEAEPVAEPGAEPDAEPAADTQDQPVSGPAERPSLAPAAIVISVEDLPAPGISVTLSGIARPDPMPDIED